MECHTLTERAEKDLSSGLFSVYLLQKIEEVVTIQS